MVAVLLLIKNLHFTVKDTITDPEGRSITAQLSIHNQELCIISVYGPNVNSFLFFHNFLLLANTEQYDLKSILWYTEQFISITVSKQ